MRYITTLLFVLFFVSAPFSFASAHTGVSGGYMMGSDQWNTNMMQFEDSFIENDELHEQMETFMEALFDGELTDEQEAQMLEWMNSDEYQPAMMSMMMRGMMGSGLESGWNTSGSTWPGAGMMGSVGYGSWWIGGWVTMVLIWGFLILGIAAFWKSLNRTRK